MSLAYIINEVSRQSGISASDDRELLVTLINTAVKEVYQSTDLPGSVMEVVIKSLPNSIMALPNWIGHLKAMREYNYYAKIELKDMRPKYSYQPWPQMWKNWRIVGPRAIQYDVINASEINISTSKVDNNPPTITITGRSTVSNRVVESILVNSTTLVTNNSFTEILTISKDKPNDTNINFYDMDGRLLATLNNDELYTRYLIVDVSELPRLSETPAGEFFVEVLFKKPLRRLINDTDEFQCEGYDDAIAFKTLANWFALQPEKLEQASAFAQKSSALITSQVSEAEGDTQKEMTFAPCPLFGLYPQQQIRYVYPR